MIGLKKSNNFDKQLSSRFVFGGILIILWFFLLPDAWKSSLYLSFQSFLGIPFNFLIGIIDISILLIACILCKYPFLKQPFSWQIIQRQCISSILLVSLVILCSTFFLTFTRDYQGNDTLLYFVIYQILFVGFLEELLFRGILIWILQKFTSSAIYLALLSSLIFALSHIGSDVFSILQITSSFIIGIVFSLLIIKKPKYFSIYNLAIVHGLFNIIVLGFTTYMQF